MEMSPTPRNPSRPVVSAQDQPHEKLLDLIARHRANAFEKPIDPHNEEAFEKADLWRRQRSQPLILDSGCGTGHSTLALATANPDFAVLGVDKSVHRLDKLPSPLPENAMLVRANLVDFYRVIAKANWSSARHYILYPNPWPKPQHVMRRWHGSPVFPDIVRLGGQVELRTNWQVYAQEFALGLSAFQIEAITEEFVPSAPPLTLFEKKYAESGQTLYRMTADLSSAI